MSTELIELDELTIFFCIGSINKMMGFMDDLDFSKTRTKFCPANKRLQQGFTEAKK